MLPIAGRMDAARSVPPTTMSTLCGWATFLALFPSSISQSICDLTTLPQPVVIPIRNVTIQNVTVRATALSIGTPPQNMGFDVAPYVNNMFMFPAGVNCNDNSPEIRCVAAVFGAYDQNSSTSWEETGLFADFAPESSNDTGLLSGAVTDLVSDNLGSDVLHVNETTSLSNFPLDILHGTQCKKNLLGVGRNSTLLSHLQSSGLVASNVWSYFYGLYGLEEGDNMDGSLVLGGYDAAKVTGQNTTQAISVDQGCLTNLMVSVSDILMNVNGQPTSIIGRTGSSINMCIDPSYRLLSLPLQMWDTFKQNAGGTDLEAVAMDPGIYVGGKPFLAEGIYPGNLTIVLSSGLHISIPNHQLTPPSRFIAQDGSLTFNASIRELMIQSLENANANDMPLLGQPFLSAAYLMVNSDRNTFTLWQSRPNTATNLVPVANASCPGAPKTLNPSSPSAKPNTSSSSLSGGAIAGIAIGSVIALALIILTIYLLIVRRRPQKAESSAGASHQHLTPYEQSSGLYEMTSYSAQPPPELPGSKIKMLPPDPPREIHGGELPASPVVRMWT